MAFSLLRLKVAPGMLATYLFYPPSEHEVSRVGHQMFIHFSRKGVLRLLCLRIEALSYGNKLHAQHFLIMIRCCLGCLLFMPLRAKQLG